MQENMETKLDTAKAKLVDVKDAAKEKLDTAGTAVKQRLGQAGRALKKVDLRQTIMDNPFAAIGIAVGVGALIGLVRPAPEPRGRISSLFMTSIGMLGIRLVREAAIKELGTFAKGLLSKDDAQSSSFGSQDNEGGNVRYTPAL